jgi:hypothetical protein
MISILAEAQTHLGKTQILLGNFPNWQSTAGVRGHSTGISLAQLEGVV